MAEPGDNVHARRINVVKVEVYTSTYCPFCTRAKNLLKSKGVAFEEIDVTEDDQLRARMVEMAGGRRTVPEIFINGKIVGGFDELKALDLEGKLDSLLAESAQA
jgi:glutaredoxin 3